MSGPLKRQLLLGFALVMLAFAAMLWQLDQSGALRTAEARAQAGGAQEHVSLPRLICPLH